MPSTRMGTAKILRDAFVAAQNYQRRLADPENDRTHDVDLTMEALVKVLRREIPWRQHAHRADDIVTALRLQAEFGYDLIIDFVVNSGPMSTGTPRSASRSATTCASVPWSMMSS